MLTMVGNLNHYGFAPDVGTKLVWKTALRPKKRIQKSV